MVKVIFLFLFLASCVTTVEIASNPKDVWCEQNKARRLSQETIKTMSRKEVDKANIHNRKGALWCGWTAKTAS